MIVYFSIAFSAFVLHLPRIALFTILKYLLFDLIDKKLKTYAEIKFKSLFRINLNKSVAARSIERENPFVASKPFVNKFECVSNGIRRR